MSRAFMDQLDEMSRQSGIDEVRKEAEALRQLNPAREIEKTIDPDGVIARQTADLARIGTTPEPPLPRTANPNPEPALPAEAKPQGPKEPAP